MSILEAEAPARAGEYGQAVHGRLRTALETTGLVVAPVTLLTALLFYFGWASSNALWMYFGVDQSVIGFSAQDYILRAVRPLFWPLGVLVLLALLVLEADTEFDAMLHAGRHRTVIDRMPALIASGAAVLLVVAFVRREGYPLFGNQPIVMPALFALGTGALSYAAQLRRRTLDFERRHRPGNRPGSESLRARSSSTLKFSLAWALLILSIFWMLGDWASDEGLRRGQMLGANLAAQPGVVIHSRASLAIDGPGVQVDVSSDPTSAYPYTYRGLSLLVRAGNRLFLVPRGWTPKTGSAVVVPESDGLRVDYTSPARP
ncbi:MAG: hypothetical protein E6G66_05545 [Actinobacteria bacterium]|nr:MAG: hypothetical protein E6G66_05545 [Actinomycetota bacterium]